MRPRSPSALLVALLAASCGGDRPAPGPAELSLAELLGDAAAPAAGFARALEPRDFVFPADHGPHPRFRSEWWYFTGNVGTAGGRRFGYQLTFFRNALAPPGERRQSAWAADNVYMAHFALTDPEGDGFHSFERLARGAGGLAGAQAEPFRVWLETWRADADTGGPPWRLRAAAGEVEIDLAVTPAKPLVLQGERGLSRKGPEPGNASYYYAYTRLATRGRVRTGDAEHLVEGTSWLDREWSTSVLPRGVVGWDWFALQLDDGRDLMLYRLRRADGSSDPFSTGALVAPDGTRTPLGATQFSLAELAGWTSPETGRRYPAAWRLTVPGAGLELDLRPLVAGQELVHSVVYWEGAVVASAAGEPAGRGYVELTGYGAPAGAAAAAVRGAG